MGDWTAADEICIAVALDSWKPTQGTRLTGQRNPGRRFVLSNNKLQRQADPSPTRAWNFPEPFGAQTVVGVPLSEIITISSHLRVPEIRSYMNRSPLNDLHDPNTPAPSAVDESGRSSQTFAMDVVACRKNEQRRATAQGRDIYAVTAPIIVEATERILDGRVSTAGTAAGGAIFDARDFLETLAPEHLSVEFHQCSVPQQRPLE
jgi:hypothetical protein